MTGAKPGWVRVSLPWYAAPEDVEFTLRAVEFVASRGEAFVPLYRLDWRDGVWRHREARGGGPVAASGSPPRPCWRDRRRPPAPPSPAEREAERAGYLAEAERIADELDGALAARAAGVEPAHRAAPTSTRWCWFRYVETEGL